MQKRRKKISTQPVTATIESFSHDGRGIARIEGKTTFIQGALKDEVVEFQYSSKKKDYDEGRVLSIIQPSQNRVLPKCLHYDLCGGCFLQHLDENVQIKEKEAILLDLMHRIGRVTVDAILEPLRSSVWNYRNKARLSVRYVEKKQATLVGFRERNNPRYIAEITQCSVLHPRVDKDIQAFRTLLDTMEDKAAIAQIEVAAGDDEIALIFRNMTELSTDDMQRLKDFGQSHQYKIFLQPKEASSVYLIYPENDSEWLEYSLPEKEISFQFHPTDFTQINPHINRLMVNKAIELLDLQPNDTVLDLFCGLGNFSLPMAKQCLEVVGVEGSVTMVDRARMNAENNKLTNTRFYAANLDDSKTFSAFKGKYTKMLIDPPRSGAMEVVKNMEQFNPDRLIYISCNPVTLARDTDILVNEKGYRLISAGVLDMFPHTQHVESMAVFYK